MKWGVVFFALALTGCASSYTGAPPVPKWCKSLIEDPIPPLAGEPLDDKYKEALVSVKKLKDRQWCLLKYAEAVSEMK